MFKNKTRMNGKLIDAIYISENAHMQYSLRICMTRQTDQRQRLLEYQMRQPDKGSNSEAAAQ